MTIRFAAAQAGFTAIEACCTVAVAATLLGTGVPSFKKMLTTRHLEGISAQVVTDVMHARSEAVARGEGVRISFKSVAGGSCYVVHTGNAGDCGCDAAGVAVCSGGAKEVKTVFWPGDRGVQVAANVGSMLFEPVHGTAVPTGTVHITAADGRAIHHVVNIMGRPRACSPGAAVRGYRAC